MNIIISLLLVLLYALIACLCVELILYILGLFFAVPPKIRQLLYAIVGVVVLIYLVQVVLGATPALPGFPHDRPHQIP